MNIYHNAALGQDVTAVDDAGAQLAPIEHRATALMNGGFGDFMLPIIPAGARVSGQSRLANGKVPGEWTGTSWRNAWGWPKMAPLGYGAWKSLPAHTGIGLRTGSLVAFDIDVKVDPTSTDPHDMNARRLAEALRRELARHFGLPVNRLPRRERAGSTSSMIFARTEDELFKRWMTFEAAGRRYVLEFLATGQQVVVSGLHISGSVQKTNLMNCKFADLPLVSAADVTGLFVAFKEKAEAIGYSVDVKPERKPAAPTTVVRDPIKRAVLERRKDWLPDVLDLGLNMREGELRVSSEHLGRELEEDLAIYPDGIHDYGTRRSHDPISLICEFGKIDDDGNVQFGGAPEYRASNADDEEYVAVDNGRSDVERPSPAQAVTWLCRRLGSDDFPRYAGTPDWQSASKAVATAMGYRIDDIGLARVFDFVDWTAMGTPEPQSWRDDEIRDHAKLLAAVRVANPLYFAHLIDHWAGLSNVGLSVSRIDELLDEGFRDAPPLIEPAPKATSDLEAVEWIDPCRDWEGVEAQPRKWEVEGWIPHGEVTLLYGDGGIGKTLLAQQYASCAAAGRSWLGQITRPARVMCVFCEDSTAELHRRQIDINRSIGIGFSDLKNMRLVSRNFRDNFMGISSRQSATLAKTAFWYQIRDDAIAFGADVLILDTLADIYAGSELDRVQVSDFVKRFLGGLGAAVGGSVIALGHPSAAGKSSGEGTSGSTGWNNAARSRIYLEYPGSAKTGDIRQLTNKKLNYGAKGAGLKLRYNRGAFEVIAGAMPAALRDGTAVVPPSVHDAAENAIVSALMDCAGDKVQMSRAPNSQYYAPRLIKARAPDLFVAFSDAEVTDALARLEGRGAVRLDEVGRRNGRALMSYVVVPDRLSGIGSGDGGVFE